MDESAKQLELPHFHVDGEDQWQMWTDPESGKTATKLLLLLWFFDGVFLFSLGQREDSDFSHYFWLSCTGSWKFWKIVYRSDWDPDDVRWILIQNRIFFCSKHKKSLIQTLKALWRKPAAFEAKIEWLCALTELFSKLFIASCNSSECQDF